jgi:hypothetical protein
MTRRHLELVHQPVILDDSHQEEFQRQLRERLAEQESVEASRTSTEVDALVQSLKAEAEKPRP